MISDESRERLNLILEKGDVKYNVTVIFSEQAKNITTISYDKWYKQHISSADGIWVGNGITEQYQLKPNKITAEMREEIPFGFGFAIQKGKAVKVKLLCSEKGDAENDE